MSRITFEQVAAFHGHVCPGLAIGYRMTLAGLDALTEARADDEQIIAVVENDACGIDAVQVVSGCTFGKGNLIFRDYGKSVYTFFSRRTGKGVRVVWQESRTSDAVLDDRQARIEWILAASESDIVAIQPLHVQLPPKARLQKSVDCDICGERVMETRIHRIEHKNVCIPCRHQRSD